RVLVLLITPTHAFNAPWTVWRHIARLPRRGAEVACLFTRAAIPWKNRQIPGIAGTGPLCMTAIAAGRGYRPLPPISIDMPSNWTAVHPGIPQDRAIPIVIRGMHRARAFFGDTVTGTSRWITANTVWDLLFGLLLLPITAGYLAIGRMLLAKIFFTDTRCNRCGICVEECPEKAIVMPETPDRPVFWTWRCESCMRCMNTCPQRAVQVSTPWVTGLIILMMWLTGSSGIFALIRQIPDAWIIRSWLGHPPLSWAITVLVSWGVIVGGYRLFYRFSRWRWFRSLLTATAHTRWFRQYLAPKQPPGH
ncbi:4Fe-4S binding protein, partial [bacterium]|nr:4Fe-4S binding protein [candidate division CSSED10-310 bacterium]